MAEKYLKFDGEISVVMNKKQICDHKDKVKKIYTEIIRSTITE